MCVFRSHWSKNLVTYITRLCACLCDPLEHQINMSVRPHETSLPCSTVIIIIIRVLSAHALCAPPCPRRRRRSVLLWMCSSLCGSVLHQWVFCCARVSTTLTLCLRQHIVFPLEVGRRRMYVVRVCECFVLCVCVCVWGVNKNVYMLFCPQVRRRNVEPFY